MGGNSCSKPKNQVAVAPRDSKHGGGSSSSNRSNRRPFPERTEEEDTPSYLYGHSHVTKVAPSPSRARNEREDDDDRELTVTSDSTAGNGGAFTRDNSVSACLLSFPLAYSCLIRSCVDVSYSISLSVDVQFGQQQHSGFTSRSISSPKNNNATRTDGCPTANIFDQGNADAEFTYRGGLKGLKLKPEGTYLLRLVNLCTVWTCAVCSYDMNTQLIKQTDRYQPLPKALVQTRRKIAKAMLKVLGPLAVALVRTSYVLIG